MEKILSNKEVHKKIYKKGYAKNLVKIDHIIFVKGKLALNLFFFLQIKIVNCENLSYYSQNI